VALAHFSVKEYLVSKRISEGQTKRFSLNLTLCHWILTKCCVQYLLRVDAPYVPKEAVWQKFVLSSYSASNLAYYYSFVQSTNPELKDLVIELLETTRALRSESPGVFDPRGGTVELERYAVTGY
jgi:hypothetical protein